MQYVQSINIQREVMVMCGRYYIDSDMADEIFFSKWNPLSLEDDERFAQSFEKMLLMAREKECR